MSEWKECKIGDVCKIKRGASPRPIQKFISDKGMPWVKIADATSTDSMFLDNTKEYIVEDGVPKSVTVLPGTLIVSNSATPGLPKIIRIKACVHDGWLILSDYKNVLRDFMYYKFVEIRKLLSNQANGSVFQNLKTDIVREFSIKIPSLKSQDRIVSILKSLDDKIEVNRRINENLEQQAQALFKSWFVDFEPFKDGEFVESELGMIPKGWRVGTIGDYCKVRSGYAFKSSWWSNCGIPVIKIKNITDDGRLDMTDSSYVSNEHANLANEFQTKVGDLLIAMTGATIGKFCIVHTNHQLCVNQRVGKFFLGDEPLKKLPFVYYNLKRPNVFEEIVRKGQGSAQPNISGKDIENVLIAYPKQEVISQFNQLIYPSLEKIIRNLQESQHLAILRETLLPKLMSGELKVNDLVS